MGGQREFIYEIQYTKAAEKFFKVHEDVREDYKKAVREILTGEHPETEKWACARTAPQRYAPRGTDALSPLDVSR